jgi:hypothetical protein
MEELLKKMDPRTASLAMVGMTLLVVAALAVYVVWPQVKDYRNSLSTLEVLERVAQNGDELEQEMAALQQDVDGLVQRLHGDMVNMPKNQLEAFVIGRLQGISWRNNMELRAVTPGKGDAVLMFEEVLFDVEVAGEYFDLFAWLQDLGEELGYVVVKHFSIGPGGREASDTRLNARFTVVSYREVGDA